MRRFSGKGEGGRENFGFAILDWERKTITGRGENMNRVSFVLVWVLLVAVIGLSVQVYRLSVKRDCAEFGKIKVQSVELVSREGVVGGTLDYKSIQFRWEKSLANTFDLNMTLYGPQIRMKTDYRSNGYPASTSSLDLGAMGGSQMLNIRRGTEPGICLSCNTENGKYPYGAFFPVQLRVDPMVPVSPAAILPPTQSK